MRLYDRYLMTLAALFAVTTVVLSGYRRAQLDMYFSFYLLEYLVATLLFAYLHQRAQRLLNGVGYVLFTGLVAIVGMRVAQILGLVRPAP